MRRLPVPADWLKHGDKGLESADWRLFPIPGGLAHLSLEAALGDLVLVPSQEMPELVEEHDQAEDKDKRDQVAEHAAPERM